MSAEHTHPPRCCCESGWVTVPDHPCPGCPEHGALATPEPHSQGDMVDLVGALRKAVEAARERRLAERAATPYTEQETTK